MVDVSCRLCDLEGRSRPTTVGTKGNNVSSTAGSTRKMAYWARRSSAVITGAVNTQLSARLRPGLCPSGGDLAEALQAQRDTSRHDKLVPLALSTCGEFSVDIQRGSKDLAKLRAQSHRIDFTAADETGPIAREAGAFRSELSMTLQDALCCRTRVCLSK